MQMNNDAPLLGVHRSPAHPAHGVDAVLYALDPVYHKLVAQGVLMRRHYASRGLRSPEQFERLYAFTSDDWAARRVGR
jgi:hypothetical protein